MTQLTQDRSIDPAFIARVARAVIAQLQSNIPLQSTQAESPDSSIANDPAFEAQLGRRGIELPPGTQVLWTDGPAKAVVEQCRAGHQAVMISAYSDVERFAEELSPSVWVLDRKKLNLVAAVNATARIAHVASRGARS